jgi:hypothetical protein
MVGVLSFLRNQMPNKEGKPIPSDLPAGHQRDELNRRITDDLAQQAAEEAAEVGQERIDPSKFKHVDNEIAQPWEEQKKREREAGFNLLGMSAEEMNNRVGVTNPVPGYYYKWLNHEDCYTTPEARAAVRAGLEIARKAHFFPVTDTHDAEVAKEFKKDGGLRRWGDLVLWAIHIEDFQALMKRNAMLLRRQGMVEENYVNTSAQRIAGHGAAYDTSNPRFARLMGAEKVKPFTAQVVAEGEERR